MSYVPSAVNIRAFALLAISRYLLSISVYQYFFIPIRDLDALVSRRGRHRARVAVLPLLAHAPVVGVGHADEVGHRVVSLQVEALQHFQHVIRPENVVRTSLCICLFMMNIKLSQ